MMRLLVRSRLLRRVSAVVAGATIGILCASPLLPPQYWQERAQSLAVSLNRAFTSFSNPNVERVVVKNEVARKIVAAAHAQEGDIYDASYRQISYPNGDVPTGRGACTDVVVRSLRGAGIDLQTLIHEDISHDFARYSDLWGLGHPDANIDHRRVPNLMVFFRKYGQSLPLGVSGEAVKTWQPGDVVCWKNGSRWHTGVVSDGIGPRGLPLIVHNGSGCVEQDCLDNWKIIGHFRYLRKGKPDKNPRNQSSRPLIGT